MEKKVISLAVVVSLVLLFLGMDIHADETDTSEEREMIELLDILEHYDMLRSYDLYENLGEIAETDNNNTIVGTDAGEREDIK